MDGKPSAPAPRNRAAERRTVKLMQTAVLVWYSPAWPPACSCCGTTENLGIEHVNGDGKQQREALFGLNTVTGRFYRWIIEHGFPKDPPLQVHCLPCNSSKGTGEACRLDHAERDRQLDRLCREQLAIAEAQAVWREQPGNPRLPLTKLTSGNEDSRN